MLNRNLLTPTKLVELHSFEYNKLYSQTSSKIKQLQATQSEVNIFEYLCTQKILVPYGAEFCLNNDYVEINEVHNLDVSLYAKLSLDPKQNKQVSTKTNILNIFKDIKIGIYKDLCFEIRELAQKERTATTPEEVTKYHKARTDKKAQLKCFTTSGLFPDNNRNQKSLLQGTYTQLMQVDFDYKGNETVNFEKLRKDILDNLSCVLACFTSPSGDLKLFIKHNAPVEKHLQAFNYIEKIFNDNFYVQIDKSCKDISRVCYVSYDPNIYVNENCESLTIDYDVEVIEKVQSIAVAYNSAAVGTNKFNTVYELAVNWTEKHYNFVDGKKADYRYCLAYILNLFGVSLQDAHDFINSNYPDARAKFSQNVTSAYRHTNKHATKIFNPYKPKTKQEPKKARATAAEGEIIKSINAGAKSGVSKETHIKTMVEIGGFNEEQVKGIYEKIDNGEFKKELDILNKEHPITQTIAILNWYEISKNLITGEYFSFDKKISKEEINEIFLECRIKNGIQRNDFDTILNSQRSIKTFNPFDDLIAKYKAMPKTKGNINALFNTLNLAEPEHKDVLGSIFRKWFIGFWAQLIGEKKTDINEIAICFLGKKKMGKSQFFTRMIEKTGFDFANCRLEDERNNDNIQRHMTQNPFVFLDDVSSKAFKNTTLWKFILGAKTYSYVEKFEKNSCIKKRSASVFCTTNENTIVHDAENNRRIIPIKLEFMPNKAQKQCYDFDLYNAIDKQKVFAEALQAYLSGEEFVINDTEEKIITILSKNAESKSFIDNVILEHIRPATENDAKEIVCYFTSTELFNEFRQFQIFNDMKIKEFGELLKSDGLGFYTVSKKREDIPFKMYKIILLKPFNKK